MSQDNRERRYASMNHAPDMPSIRQHGRIIAKAARDARFVYRTNVRARQPRLVALGAAVDVLRRHVRHYLVVVRWARLAQERRREEDHEEGR